MEKRMKFGDGGTKLCTCTDELAIGVGGLTTNAVTKRPTPINADTLNAWIMKRGRQYRGELERLLELDLEYGILDMPDLIFQAFMRRIQLKEGK